ncbi:glucosamine-6-phosphate deaminase [Paenibacillus radicis (ex Gao et al. 2016)]|uniref:Glucosamine-6-phosphate deaminase n=1 Tax=Paenibacillus radicis (ex Gao et al. 2016) TaxID=1737354 RepID=A0A917LSL7_9BACL|nr:glucosamine-6-phosphate deaminase [Paenibacillus radicis (ex Gao et al. 2016)]GGG54163.1 glucosamine-6-phosphate deaminase [Paenibacillus radicis (ex Gao et al. 2016)]
MNVLTFATNEELSAYAADFITDMVRAKPDAVLGLATGETPIGVYEQLVARYREGRVSFRQVKAFNLDEYAGLSQGHTQSYQAYMHKHLFSGIDLPLEQAYIPCGRADDRWGAARDYDRLLDEAGQLDLQLLGIGHNGHIGFNEPGEELHAQTHVVRLKEETRAANSRYFESLAEVPEYAITMGVGPIMKARQLLLIVRGEDKAAVLKKALLGPITTQCPASLLQLHPQLTVLLDEGAAKEL